MKDNCCRQLQIIQIFFKFYGIMYSKWAKPFIHCGALYGNSGVFGLNNGLLEHFTHDLTEGIILLGLSRGF